MTPIAIPIFVQQATTAITQMRQAVAAGAGIIELRCDTAAAEDLIAAVEAKAGLCVDGGPLPVIVTIRPTWEGGRYAGDENTRIDLFRAALRAGADFIDIELVAWQRSAELRRAITPLLAPPTGAGPGRLIISNHDFTGRPADLDARVAALAAVPEAAILKLAFKASSVADAADALALTYRHTQRDPRPLLALAMGEFGQLSRVLGAKYHQPFTFASIPEIGPSAPGQPELADLLDTFHWNTQTPDTAFFGIAGYPVSHSMGPFIHNAGFANIGFNGVYTYLPIAPDYPAFAAALDSLRTAPGLHLRGLSVTLPHKENALRWVLERGGEVDELSRHIGVINTLLLRPDGTLFGCNTDYAGALDALADAMAIQREGFKNYRVAVLGAGGAARAIVAGLAHYGATVVIYNRRFERAAKLAADFNGKTGKVVAAPLEKLCQSCCQIYINCTPLGMHPNVEACPIAGEPPFTADTVVFDTIYNPLRTRLLELAEARGCRTVSGMEMFLRQAAFQFRHFTGQDAPTALFQRIILERLARRPA